MFIFNDDGLRRLPAHAVSLRWYYPWPVKRVEIPKPSGGLRPLSIPTVVDLMIQQAIAQVLTVIFDPGFSDHSYGFRPNRSAHDAVKQVQAYVKEGY